MTKRLFVGHWSDLNLTPPLFVFTLSCSQDKITFSGGIFLIFLSLFRFFPLIGPRWATTVQLTARLGGLLCKPRDLRR